MISIKLPENTLTKCNFNKVANKVAGEHPCQSVISIKLPENTLPKCNFNKAANKVAGEHPCQSVI